MSTSTIEALARAWARISEEPELPPDYQGTATPQTPPAIEPIKEQIRERILPTNQNRLFLSIINKNEPNIPLNKIRIPSLGLKKRGG
ncbi:hypothetical protein ACVGWF_00465, partial [Enterobacter asburiae]